MFKEPTVRQHYVQRKYLEPWCNERNQLWIYRVNEDKFFQAIPEKVFVQKGYYRLPALNKEELTFLSLFVDGKYTNHSTAQRSIETLDDLLSAFKFLTNGIVDMQEGRKSPIQHLFDLLLCFGSLAENEKNIFHPKLQQMAEYKEFFENSQMQVIESVLSEIESSGFSAIQKLYKQNELEEDDFDHLLIYCGVQYYRTTFAGEVIDKLAANSKNINIKKIRPFIQLVSGLKLAEGLRVKAHEILVLVNKTTINFITGEQPIVNMLAVSNGETHEIELFYPISPQKALLIRPAMNSNVSNETILESKEIEKFNRKIIQNSSVIAAKEKEDIELYF